MEWIYEIEMFVDVGTEENPEFDWITEKRYYSGKKELTDFDLHDVKGKRRNARFLGTRKFRPSNLKTD